MEHVGFQVHSGVATKNSVFWDMSLCITVKVNRRFGETYRLQSSACCLLHAGFSFYLPIEPEIIGDMFFRNIRCLSTNYTALCSDR